MCPLVEVEGLKRNQALENSFYSDMKIQSTDKMTDGVVPVPPYRPCAYRIEICYLFRNYRILGGSRSGGGKTPVGIQRVIEHFSRV